MSAEAARAAVSLADLAQVLESREQASERLLHALERVRRLVGSDACALAAASGPLAGDLLAAPDLGPEERGRIRGDARALLRLVVAGAPSAAPVRLPGPRPHLAVPLVGRGEVVGLVLVERGGGAYGEGELQLLAVAAAQLGTYLAGLSAEDEARRTERALRDALTSSRADEERKDRFLSVLSHELRNPLAPLRNAVYLLERSHPGSETARRAGAIIGRQVDHLARLVEDLLDVTRISTGKIQLKRARLDLVEVVRAVVEDHRPVLLEAGVELLLAAPAQPLWVDGDETRIAQVVGNLLGNARKFTSPGGRVEVVVERAAPAMARVRVRDDGLGMSAETLGRIFEPFAQGEETLHRNPGGLGLGLALARGLVELHGGNLSARSEGPGRGAEFELALPLGRHGPAQAAPSAPEEPGARARRILVIDDNRDGADSLRDLLRLAGHTVEAAYDGPSGIALALASPPDLVLCDIGLPGMSGFEVARRLREHPALDQTVLVAVTGYGAAEEHRQGADAGFTRYLLKPIDPGTLRSLLGDDAPGG